MENSKYLNDLGGKKPKRFNEHWISQEDYKM